ncbi:hypothetical protein Pan161_32890 [Gimesia algae]|uniref:Uncharacterized protein n=1 Tax=Gimesia algae TaxID=2527971 RepID=A0A517VF85_9PLAN|nr:hypothetical protein Pan161_32890 [Gimesia algae]
MSLPPLPLDVFIEDFPHKELDDVLRSMSLNSHITISPAKRVYVGQKIQ